MTETAAPRPALKGARIKRRHWLVLASFGMGVLLPCLAVSVYLWGVAADQYHSTMRFSVKSSQSLPRVDFLAGLTQVNTPESEDLNVLEDFIKSQAMVAALTRQVDLEAVFKRPDFDPVFAYRGSDRIAELTDYWQRMVEVIVYHDQGIVAIRVQAFSPEDAQKIAGIVLTESQQLITQLSNIAREDALRIAGQELQRAAARLSEVRQALFAFRNRYQVTDPQLDVTTQMAVIAELTQLKTNLLIDLELLGDSGTAQNQRQEALSRRLATVERRITEERARLGQGTRFSASGTEADFAALTGRFEELSTELEIAQQSYLSAQQAYDQALTEADRRSRLLIAHIPPTKAEASLYPQRGLILMMTALLSVLFWSVAVLVYYSQRESR